MSEEDQTKIKQALPKETNATAISQAKPPSSRADKVTALTGDVSNTGGRSPKDSEGKRITSGSIINQRFIIEKVLGRGGMGVVYRALDKRKQEAKDRKPYVAIKVLSDSFRKHPASFIALQREARKSQDLAHPNVITVYDFDRDGDIVYITMEELSGSPLDKYIRDNPAGLPIKEATHIIKGIAQGLAYAHSKKIVHSDLKPGNVFVTNDGNVKILDFGIARAVSNMSEQASSEQTLFDASLLGGLTPAYASFEMFEGQEPDTSDDIYALGLIAYEVFTGDHPFQRDHATKVSANNRKPDKIKDIPNHQWRTIATSLELMRENRIDNATTFLKKFEGIPKTTIGLSAALIAAITILGSVALFRQPATGPEIAFNRLPIEEQQKINTALEQGREALKFNDINGALIFFNQAYELHPRNKQAVKELDKIVDMLTSKKLGANSEATPQALKSRVDIMLQYSALSDNKRLLKLREKLNTAE
ncbi:MAG: serine/threonine protein kinase [Cellvibrionaceae bacterium]|nr:serine/threonine protein kinase [Cellvibrionaceae bacterium]